MSTIGHVIVLRKWLKKIVKKEEKCRSLKCANLKNKHTVKFDKGRRVLTKNLKGKKKKNLHWSIVVGKNVTKSLRKAGSAHKGIKRQAERKVPVPWSWPWSPHAGVVLNSPTHSTPTSSRLNNTCNASVSQTWPCAKDTDPYLLKLYPPPPDCCSALVLCMRWSMRVCLVTFVRRVS